MKKAIAISAAILMLLAGAAACGGDGGTTVSKETVYVMTNSASGNEVFSYARGDDGTLAQTGTVATQGKGAGSSLNPLGSQGALVLSKDGKWVLAVNAGSNEISVLKVVENGLEFASKTSSLGQSPISLAVSGNLVFVLNQKSIPPNITPFTIDNTGVLTVVPDGVRLLTPGSYSQIGFSPNGKWLAVAGQSNNLILVYTMNGNNASQDPFTIESNGRGPAAFAFDKDNNLIVAESGSNAVSSYSISGTGLKSITASLASGQTTPQKIAVSGNYVYTVNTGSDNISSYAVSTTVSGQLTLLHGNAATASGPVDLAASSDGKFLFVLDPSVRSIHVFQIGTDGELTPAGTTTGNFGVSAQGIAAG